MDRAYEELGVRTFPPAPAGFDPVAAEPDELRRYGYPDRPDESAHPDLYASWHRLMSRPVTMVEPRFVAVPRWTPPEPTTPPTTEPSGPALPPTGSSGNWAGFLGYSGGFDPVISVTGQWTVPNAVPPTFDFGVRYACAAWIGIDGYLPGRPDYPAPAGFVQAGTTTQVTAIWPLAEPLVSSWVWWEWVPAGSTAITSLKV
jgi:hypothetical protein